MFPGRPGRGINPELLGSHSLAPSELTPFGRQPFCERVRSRWFGVVAEELADSREMLNRGFPQAAFPVGDGKGGNPEVRAGFLLSESQPKASFLDVLA